MGSRQSKLKRRRVGRSALSGRKGEQRDADPSSYLSSLALSLRLSLSPYLPNAPLARDAPHTHTRHLGGARLFPPLRLFRGRFFCLLFLAAWAARETSGRPSPLLPLPKKTPPDSPTMRNLLVRRTRSVRAQEEMAGALGGGGEGEEAGEKGSPPPPPPGPSAPPPPPPPRARMPLVCRAAALVAAALGLYFLAAALGTALAAALAASLAKPHVACILLALYGLSEFLFYLFLWRPRYRALDAARLSPPASSRAEAMAQFERLLALRGRLRASAKASRPPLPPSPRAAAARAEADAGDALAREREEVRNYLSGWFRGADPARVRRGNVADLLSMGFWYHSPWAAEQGKGNGGNGNGNGNGGNGTNDDNNPPPQPLPSSKPWSRASSALGASTSRPGATQTSS